MPRQRQVNPKYFPGQLTRFLCHAWRLVRSGRCVRAAQQVAKVPLPAAPQLISRSGRG